MTSEEGEFRASGDAPLSYAQQGVWFMERRAGHTRHTDPVTFRLVGELDATALRAGIEELVARHEALRTFFPVVDGLPVQRVSPRAEVPLPLTDLTALPAAEREEAAARFLAEDLRRPFDLARGPVVRAALVRLAPREHIVRVTLHHMISDAWSWWAVLLRELEQLYAARLHGRASPLPPVPTQYRAFVRRQHDWLTGPAYPRQLAYWKQALANATPLPPLALASTSPPGTEQPPRTRWSTFPQPLYDRLRLVARREHVTLFMLLLAAFTRVLRRYVDTDDILVATRGGYRRAEFEKAVGFFVNLLPVRTRVPAGVDFRELLHQVRRNLIGVYAHRDVPFERLTHDLGLWRPGFRPAISVCVSFQTTPEVPPALEGLDTTLINHDPFSPYPLDLGFYEDAGALSALLVHHPGEYDDTAAARLLDDLRRVLEEACHELEQDTSRQVTSRQDTSRQVTSHQDTSHQGTPQEDHT
ncbi:condensation domain-containing protein [Streptomyces sp. NPDC041068]|uniref:condensation domain-containing protein n=1 Tax=Streptomyces sp. NPDC041068 TaxID=3155130 RepID=UPI0033E9F0C9